jgi:DNA replication and repair protein RecF
MYLVQFTCRGFRVLCEVCFEPGPGVNVVCGANAQGKTSLLEAILFTATARSHRTTVETDLVAYGQHEFHLSAQARRRDRDVGIEAHWWDSVKRFRVNGVAQTRISDILGKINVVLFSPEDIVLIKGTAAHRRRFLDMELSQINPAYLNALQQYRQALRQRNELLRDPAPDSDLLDAWDAQLARYGVILVRERQAFIDQLAGRATAAYECISAGERLSLEYWPDIPATESLQEVLSKARAIDLRRRATMRGPHRDDLHVTIADQPARAFASQGQQKTAALALKLAELGLVKERTGEYPILMLDEVLSELDETRSRRLFETIDPEVQCVITTIRSSGHGGLFPADHVLFRIERGNLEKQ